MTRVLTIGVSRAFLNRLDGHVSPGSIVVLEEPDIITSKHIDRLPDEYESVAEVIPAAYHQAEDYLPAALAAHRRHGVDAVVPVREYGVRAAAALADRLGLPGATATAAAVLRDKIKLREVTSAAGIGSPQWREVTGAGDVAAFATAGAVVVKPANRQASVGVQFVDRPDEADRAWSEMVTASEPGQVPNRPIQWRYLAEERLHGREYSVEALVRAGEIIFWNVTAKTTLPGRYPVEIAHVVPAPVR